MHTILCNNTFHILYSITIHTTLYENTFHGLWSDYMRDSVLAELLRQSTMRDLHRQNYEGLIQAEPRDLYRQNYEGLYMSDLQRQYFKRSISSICQTMFGLKVPFFWGATRQRVVIPVVIPQFHLVAMTTLWRLAF